MSPAQITLPSATVARSKGARNCLLTTVCEGGFVNAADPGTLGRIDLRESDDRDGRDCVGARNIRTRRTPMPDRFTLRAWAIITGNGNLLESRASSSWCPVVMYRRPITAARALKRIRETHPDASAVRVRVTIEVLHETVSASAPPASAA